MFGKLMHAEHLTLISNILTSVHSFNVKPVKKQQAKRKQKKTYYLDREPFNRRIICSYKSGRYLQDDGADL